MPSSSQQSSIKRSRLLLIICLPLLLALAGASSFDGIHYLRNEDRAYLLQSTSFTICDRVELLPESVRVAFAKSIEQPFFSMANPGQDYQETDVVVDEGLPDRRLIFAVNFKDYVLLHYEKGGIGHSYHVLLFKVSGTTSKLAWRAASFNKFNSLGELRAAIKQDKLMDNPSLYW